MGRRRRRGLHGTRRGGELRGLAQLVAGAARVGAYAIQGLVQGDAEAELIARCGGGALVEDLGRHVARSTGALAVAAGLVVCEAEVDDARAVVADQDVVRLDIAVHEARPVSCGEADGGFAHDAHHVAPIAVAGDPRPQWHAGHELHDDIDLAIELADVVHRDHVRMRELAERASLADHALAIGGTRRDQLHRDLAVEGRVICREHGPHRSATDAVKDDEAAQSGRVIAAEQGRLDLGL